MQEVVKNYDFFSSTQEKKRPVKEKEGPLRHGREKLLKGNAGIA